jgi:nucleotide-binding universal stress UspA family protein
MKEGRKNILVPIDFQEPSLKALEMAMNVAKLVNGTIHLLYVIPKGDFLTELSRGSDELVKIADAAKNRLNEIDEKYPDVKMTTKIEKGRVHDKILEIASELNARYIIIGENHYMDDKVKVLGSTVTQVVSRSTIPVITVKGDHTTLGKRIVVPLDLSKETRAQVFNAIAFGMHYNATIHLVSVLMGGISLTKSRIYAKLKKAQRTITENGIDCTIKLFNRTEDPPYKLIIKYGEEVDADMYMIMTHQESVSKDNYIGAVAHNIINESPKPVISLTVTAAESDQTAVLKKIVDPLGIFFDQKLKVKSRKKGLLNVIFRNSEAHAAF